MARTHFNGPVASANGFEGDIIGDIVGDVTGNVVGNVTGDLTGNVDADTASIGTIAVSIAGAVSDATNNIALTTTAAGKKVTINSRTESTDTANSLIGVQIKPGRGISAATDVIGAEISPRLNDAIALTGTGSMIGLHTDVYLKGTTGDIAGDVRGQQIELVDDTGSSRTVAGDMTHLRIRSNMSCTVTGDYSVIKVEDEEGTKAFDAFAQIAATNNVLVAEAVTGGAAAVSLKIMVGTTVYFLPLYAATAP